MHMCISRKRSGWEREDHWYFFLGHHKSFQTALRPIFNTCSLRTRIGTCSYTQAFSWHCASVYVSSALTRHHLSGTLTAFNQTLDSEIEMEPYSMGTAVTMVTAKVCDPPTSQRRQRCLLFSWKNINFVRGYPSLPVLLSTAFSYG